MKRIIVLAVAAVAAAAPAAGGLLGNQSFASSVPVRSAAAPAAVSRSVTPVTGTPIGTGKAKHNDDPAGDNHGKAKHGADDDIVSTTSATIVPVSAKSATRQAEKGDDHDRGRGSDDKGTDDKGKHGGHDDGPRHT
jgi:hypothetical protein